MWRDARKYWGKRVQRPVCQDPSSSIPALVQLSDCMQHMQTSSHSHAALSWLGPLTEFEEGIRKDSPRELQCYAWIVVFKDIEMFLPAVMSLQQFSQLSSYISQDCRFGHVALISNFSPWRFEIERCIFDAKPNGLDTDAFTVKKKKKVFLLVWGLARVVGT